MSIELCVWENEKTVLTTYGGGEIDIAFEPYIKQDTDEYHVQTIAYDFAQNSKYLSLQKFGYIDNNELYVEYLINDEYLTSNNNFDYKHICVEITALLLTDKASLQYIQKNNTSKITISFSNDSNPNGNCVKYSLEL